MFPSLYESHVFTVIAFMQYTSYPKSWTDRWLEYHEIGDEDDIYRPYEY